MAEASGCDRTLNISRNTSKKSIRDVCDNLKSLQDGQVRLEKQVEDLTSTLKMLLDVQRQTSARIAALPELSQDQRSTMNPDAKSQTMPNSPYPQFNAGQRLTYAFEPLESILLELPNSDVLFAQRVSPRFRSVIAGSSALQLRLFLASPLHTSKNVILNPILTDEKILPHIPLYFDEKELKLAYCHRGDRKRVYCKMATVVKDDITEQEWVDLNLSNRSTYSFGWLDDARHVPIGAGSWKQMCLSQPPCDIKWRLSIVDGHWEHRYSGMCAGRPTMDTLLDALAAAAVVDEGEQRYHPNRC